MDRDFLTLVDDGLRALWQLDPVGATFAGERAYDGLLPRADPAAEGDALRLLDALAGRLACIPIPDDSAARIDARHLQAFCTAACSPFARRARYQNPAWYTGEAAFGLMSLLLANADCGSTGPLAARLDAIPAFFADGRAALRDAPLPAAWVARAQTELAALKRLLEDGLPLHAAAASLPSEKIAAALAACDRFAGAIAATGDADAACGSAHLALVMQSVHGLSESPAALERRAAAAFEHACETLEAHARRRDPARSWRAQLAQLSDVGPDESGVIGAYQTWHERALHDASALLTPAAEYRLTFKLLPAWARAVAGDLYFLFYRSPPACKPGSASTYWVAPPQGSLADVRRAHNTAAVKLVHAVHHGSIGHHTQNARARAARSRFARIAGTDGASALVLLAAGTLVEGWACYAEDLMAEVPGFYTAGEKLQLAYFKLRNIACCLADLRFHTGAYTLAQMRAFYRDEAGFAPGRSVGETTRNSMFPGSRLMYWCGTRQIAELRRASGLPVKAFHDELLAFGAAPIAWIAEELAR